MAKTIGIVGGLGVPAGIFYYRRLVHAYEQLGEPLPLLFAHASANRAVRYVRAGELDGLAAYLSDFMVQLALGGAEVAAISAITPHICIDRVIAASPVPIVNALDAIRNELLRRNKPRVALFGTRFVIESDLYGALADFGIVRPKPDEIDTIDRIYQALALRGGETPEERATIDALGNQICKRERLDAIVLGGTDLSPIYENDPPDFPTLDCAQVHVEAIVSAARQRDGGSVSG